MRKKPKIFKKENKWCIFWFYQPRSFNTFGMDRKERLEYEKICKDWTLVDPWNEALEIVKKLYRENVLQYQK